LKFVILPPIGEREQRWAAAISHEVPGLEVQVCRTHEDARKSLPAANGAFGVMDADLLEAAGQLRWLACPQAGPPPAFYFPELVASPVIVTNMRGIFNDCISEHIMSFVLAFSRGLHVYLREQLQGRWISQLEASRVAVLPEALALIVGVGGIGAATAAHCRHFGMKVTGVDPKVPEAPEGVDVLVRPDQLDAHLPQADFVIMTAPQTTATEGLFDLERFKLMKRSAVFINIGRGTSVRLLDLVAALNEGVIGGAALDVFEEEPLPNDHPLWKAPNFLMTPHVAGTGRDIDQRRLELLIENCGNLASGKPLVNIVDKTVRF
jgi:phosphoglycerate dehydrogenase-like enzyme